MRGSDAGLRLWLRPWSTRSVRSGRGKRAHASGGKKAQSDSASDTDSQKDSEKGSQKIPAKDSEESGRSGWSTDSSLFLPPARPASAPAAIGGPVPKDEEHETDPQNVADMVAEYPSSGASAKSEYEQPN